MSKKSSRGLSKKGIKGLHRVGKWPELKWSWNGMKFDTLREVVFAYYKLQLAEMKSKTPIVVDEPKYIEQKQ